MTNRFRGRADAGARLAAALVPAQWHDPVVFGLARGGLPVAAPVALRLRAPLEPAVARKVEAPGRPELGVGAVAPDGPPYLDRAGLAAVGITEDELVAALGRARAEARDRVHRYLGDRPAAEVTGRDVLLIDDGVATGSTAIAALRALREQEPDRIVFAAPVGAPEALEKLAGEADEVVCLLRPSRFRAVGEWYADFEQTTDAEVSSLLGARR
ncbi:phosphoribosyltransferase family protein [Amycolatopsis ultiminotia]|uniref:Phosphoribosyltransferase family protein n=1 Tax=Amycolatopsis ultiminotia TaxID=543629 RepID=A0ABP6V077_9PSEU